MLFFRLPIEFCSVSDGWKMIGSEKLVVKYSVVALDWCDGDVEGQEAPGTLVSIVMGDTVLALCHSQLS
jgi:hypothetical protein